MIESNRNFETILAAIYVLDMTIDVACDIELEVVIYFRVGIFECDEMDILPW